VTLAASFGFFLIPRYEFARPWWPHSVLFFLSRQELRDPGGLIEFSVDIQALEFFFMIVFVIVVGILFIVGVLFIVLSFFVIYVFCYASLR
jgi:hypothetical protein